MSGAPLGIPLNMAICTIYDVPHMHPSQFSAKTDKTEAPTGSKWKDDSSCVAGGLLLQSFFNTSWLHFPAVANEQKVKRKCVHITWHIPIQCDPLHTRQEEEEEKTIPLVHKCLLDCIGCYRRVSVPGLLTYTRSIHHNVNRWSATHALHCTGCNRLLMASLSVSNILPPDGIDEDQLKSSSCLL